MGYTHYWTSPADWAAPREWAEFTAFVRAVIAASGVDITGVSGKGKPTINNADIFLNGRAPHDDHETFHIGRLVGHWWFCKTAHKPYDVVVTACLAYLAARYGYDISSDGDASDWEAGTDLANKVSTTPIPNPLLVKAMTYG